MAYKLITEQKISNLARDVSLVNTKIESNEINIARQAANDDKLIKGTSDSYIVAKRAIY